MPGHTAGGSPRRRSGQHFLDSARLAARLVADAAIERGDRVVDLGAGTGVLTAALAERAAGVLAVELDGSLVLRLARRFGAEPNVVVLHADVSDVPLPRTPYRVVANPPFGFTAAIMRRLLDDPAGGLVRADLVVQWQVARHRVRAQESAPVDLLGATWWPWWHFARGRRLPASCFNPRPAVDAGVLTITRREPPVLAATEFTGYRAFVTSRFEARSDAPQVEVAAWVEQFLTTRRTSRRRRGGPPRVSADRTLGLHSRPETANMS